MYKFILWVGSMLMIVGAIVLVMSFAALDFAHPFDHPVGRGLMAMIGLGMALKIFNMDFDVGEG